MPVVGVASRRAPTVQVHAERERVAGFGACGGVTAVLGNGDEYVGASVTPALAIKDYIDTAGADATANIVDTGATSTWESAPSMTLFSSRGPSVHGDVIKPDVTAPGMQILAGNTPNPGPGFVEGELFQAIAGTSMSSPHVAGLFALMDQAHPDWSPAAAKSALMTTAHQDVVDNDRVTRAPPVINTTEPIDVSWSGATAGQWHLGAVAHHGDGGAPLGLTFVDVDNR